MTKEVDKICASINHATECIQVSSNKIMAAVLTAAVIGNKNTPLTSNDILDIFMDISYRLNPTPNSGNYQNWKESGGGTKLL